MILSDDIFTASLGGTRNCSKGFQDVLDGDTLATAAGVELFPNGTDASGELTLSNVARNVSSLDIDDNGETVTHAANEAVQWTMTTTATVPTEYIVKLTLTTTTGSETIIYGQRVQFV